MGSIGHRGARSHVHLRPRPPKSWAERIARAKKRKGYSRKKRGFSDQERLLAQEWETCAAGELGLPPASMFRQDEWWAAGMQFLDAILHDEWWLAETVYKKLQKSARKFAASSGTSPGT